MDERTNLLLDSKNSELEIIEFSVGPALYGINVAKVREIIKADLQFVPVADTHPSMQGAINLRGTIIPVVNLGRHLKTELPFDPKHNRIIIAEFNRIVLGFLVTSVALIHRISWQMVEEPSDMLRTESGCISGLVKIKEKVIFLLDFEKIASQINPRAGIHEPERGQYASGTVDRASKKILVVDDSDFTRNLIVKHLTEAGYQTDTLENGSQAWDRLSQLSSQPDFAVENSYHLMVTDIEMPQMDGLELVRRVKAAPALGRLPCIAFSSIISKEVIAKCRAAGADGEISKPEISDLVSMVDAKVL